MEFLDALNCHISMSASICSFGTFIHAATLFSWASSSAVTTFMAFLDLQHRAKRPTILHDEHDLAKAQHCFLLLNHDVLFHNFRAPYSLSHSFVFFCNWNWVILLIPTDPTVIKVLELWPDSLDSMYLIVPSKVLSSSPKTIFLMSFSASPWISLNLTISTRNDMVNAQPLHETWKLHTCAYPLRRPVYAHTSYLLSCVIDRRTI